VHEQEAQLRCLYLLHRHSKNHFTGTVQTINITREESAADELRTFSTNSTFDYVCVACRLDDSNIFDFTKGLRMNTKTILVPPTQVDFH